MKLKAEYKNVGIHYNGIRYDLSNLTDERLQMIYDNTPGLRYVFETEEKFEKVPDKFKNKEKFIEEPFETPIVNTIDETEIIKPVPPKYKKPSSIPKPKTNEIKKK
jgi:hypothetical protein